MLPNDPERKHRIKKIIAGIILIPLIVFAMLIMLSFAASVITRSKQISQGDYSLNTAQPTATIPTYTGSQKFLIEGAGSQSFGAAEPKLTIVEFADFACPYCRESFTGLRELGLMHPNDIKIIFRDWPGHTYSISLSLAAYCAGEQGKFWEMHDRLYQNQSDTLGKDKNDLALLAMNLGIYNDQFQTCFDNQKYLSLIQRNLADAQTLEVKGTPTWFVNGEKIEGTLEPSDWQKILNAYGIK